MTWCRAVRETLCDTGPITRPANVRPTLSEAARLIRSRRGVVKQFDQELLTAAEVLLAALEIGEPIRGQN